MKKNYFLITFLTILIFNSIAAGKDIRGERGEIKFPGYNVILVVVDCLRIDHLHCGGYFRETSPNIDNLVKESIFFDNTITQGPNTLLSFSSIFTSQYVSSHGVNALDRRLSDSVLTLAEILKIYNYKTAGIVGGLLLDFMYGLNQGFDNYHFDNGKYHYFKDGFPLALEWIKRKKENGEKFFIFIHGNDLHIPYNLSNPCLYDKDYDGKLRHITLEDPHFRAIYKRMVLTDINKKEIISFDSDDVKHLIARYDECIHEADKQIGKFLEQLKSLNLLDENTILILTADHGEELFDHDWFFHDFNLYEGSIKVPLIIRLPSLIKGEKISHQVSLIDLMPTILDLLGIEVNKEAEGHSLLPLITEKARPDFNQYIFTENSFGGVSIRTEKWKLISFPEKIELYDLENDPGEKNNLAERRPEIVRQLLQEMQAWQTRRDKQHTLSQEVSGRYSDNSQKWGIIGPSIKIMNELYQGVHTLNLEELPDKHQVK